jgi:hypothetical protein
LTGYALHDVVEQPSDLPEQPRIELTAVMSTSMLQTIAAPGEGIPNQQVRAIPILLRSSRDLTELLERLREAAVDYFASQIDEQLLGTALNTDDWDPSGTFVVADGAQLIASVSEKLNKAISDSINIVGRRAGAPPLAAEIGGGVTANFLLDPIEKPVHAVTGIIELAGVAVGLLTCHPELVMACVKVLAHDMMHSEIDHLISKMLSVGRQRIGPISMSSDSSTTMPVGCATPDPRTIEEMKKAENLSQSGTNKLGEISDAADPRIQNIDPLGQHHHL